jgi:hypothetical protein
MMTLSKLAGATLEPATSCVTGRRSNQLNYAPAVLALQHVPCCTFAFSVASQYPTVP